MIYDEVIRDILSLPCVESAAELALSGLADADIWPMCDGPQMILRHDMAYELGGGTLPAIGLTAVTTDEGLVPEDGLYLCGPDLRDIDRDTQFARAALIRVKKDTVSEGQRFYRLIKDLDHTKYHFYPEGFMLRISSYERRECVRVSREAVKNGISLAGMGGLMINAFRKNRAVEAVRLIYITAPDAKLSGLAALSRKAEAITDTIDHIGTMAVTDCDACGLKNICDEVEGLRELHFGTV